jgi:hypothetical protein
MPLFRNVAQDCIGRYFISSVGVTTPGAAFSTLAINIGGDAIAIYIAAKGHARF